MEYEDRTVEPSAEFIDPGHDYLKHLEIAARNCYKSEGRVTETSAGPFVEKLVKRLHHVGVAEHVNCIMRITHKEWNPARRAVWAEILCNIMLTVPFFGYRIDWDTRNGVTIISGNARMWRELLDDPEFSKFLLADQFSMRLSEKWPLLFTRKQNNTPTNYTVSLLDDNPLTNNNKLSTDMMKKHMIMCYRIVGSRSMSHQLVRHRLSSFLQCSQRYVDHTKKGYTYIVPPSVSEEDKAMWIADAEASYNCYEYWRLRGLPPEDAREKLPNECSTCVVMSGTIDNWFHVYRMRADNPKAQWQIRDIMNQVKNDMQERLPQLFA